MKNKEDSKDAIPYIRPHRHSGGGDRHGLRPLRPCPQGIDVASVTKFLNLCGAQGGIPETVREHYAALPHKAGECVQCGGCEERCPFGVGVIENMRRAAELFGA